MAERKGPDKFRVGQRIVLNMPAGFCPHWGAPGIIVTPRVYGAWPGPSLDGSEIEDCPGWRYAVRMEWGIDHLEEWMLRAPYAREALSTWTEFAKVTGLDLPGSCIVAKPVRRKTRQRA